MDSLNYETLYNPFPTPSFSPPSPEGKGEIEGEGVIS